MGPEEGGSGTEKADGPENLDNEDMEEDTEIDIVNTTPKKRKLKKKAHSTMGGAGPRRNLCSHDKTRQDKTRSKLLFICKKKQTFFCFLAHVILLQR